MREPGDDREPSDSRRREIQVKQSSILNEQSKTPHCLEEDQDGNVKSQPGFILIAASRKAPSILFCFVVKEPECFVLYRSEKLKPAEILPAA